MPGSILEPHGPKTSEIAALWWFMLGLALVVLVLVFALFAMALLAQRGKQPATGPGPISVSRAQNAASNAVVVVFGLAVPTVVLLALLFVDVRTLAAIANPPTTPSLTITVVGHQFWWEFQYAESVTAGEAHIPANQPVALKITSNDVIHSFWVPQLLGKLDANPYQINTTWLQADSPATYRGECAEFCGAQHAHMGFLVVADTPDDFATWLNQQKQPAVTSNAEAQPGAQAFARAGCIQCHTIRYGGGTSGVGGTIGPDLTHVGSRHSIAGNTLDNNLGNMAGWIGNPQAIKPGSNMPTLTLDADTLRSLANYLEALK